MSTGRLGAGDTAIQPTILDAKADLITATAADTPARLAVGANDTVLTADSSTATGLKWAAITAPTTSWTAYTTSTSNITVGNGSLTTEYFKQGTFVAVRLRFVLGSTSSIDGSAYFTLPFTASDATRGVAGQCFFYDDSANSPYDAIVFVSGNNNIYFNAIQTSGNYTNCVSISSTVPFTWATNDGITTVFVYEAA